jgi:hypothetical protein
VPADLRQQAAEERARGRRGTAAKRSGSEPPPPGAAPEALEQATKRGAAARTRTPTSAAPDDELLQRILEAVPALGSGDAVELGGAAQQLRAAQLLAKTAPSTKLFRKYPERFELTPARQPNKVRYRAP